MLVYADARPLQGAVTGERGVGRYVAELAVELTARHPGEPALWVLDPAGPVPTQVPDLLWGGRLVFSDPALPVPDLWHVMWAFDDLHLGPETVWPAWARGVRTKLCVTLYDVIPLVFPERYLREPRTKASYLARCEIVRSADRVLAISEATARDAVRLLGLEPSRVDVIGAALPRAYRSGPPAGAPTVPGLREGFLMYTGGMDPRKNVGGLLAAYALLDAATRARHQLAIVCRATPEEIARVGRQACELGIEDDVLLTGYVPDLVLRQLYASTALFVFPSLYEGFGFPLIEAMACGAPVIAADNSSLREIVTDPSARFDAADPVATAAAIERALAGAQAGGYRQPDVATAYRWQDVADRVVDSYRAMAREPDRRHRPLVWLVSPMPPERSGVADYSLRLLHALARRAEVIVLCAGGEPAVDLPGVHWLRYEQADAAERVFGTPDARFMAMGNSEFHVPVLRLLRRYGGIALAHDVRLTGLVAETLKAAPGLVDTSAAEVLRDAAAERRAARHRDHRWMSPHEYYRANGLLTAEALRGAGLVAVHSEPARALAQLAMPARAHDTLAVTSFGHPLRARGQVARRDVVASFGIHHWSKDSVKVCTAFVALARRLPDLTFAMIGPFRDDRDLERCRAMIQDAGVAGRVLLEGWVPEDEYERWLGRARLAVQLRAYSNGESSAAVADCLGAGVPVVVSADGPALALTDFATPVAPDATAADLADLVADLLADEPRLARLGEAGREYAEAHSFDRAAADLLALGGVLAPGE